MRESLPKVAAFVGAAAMYLLVSVSTDRQPGAAGVLVSGKQTFQVAMVGAVLGYGLGLLLLAFLPKTAESSRSQTPRTGDPPPLDRTTCDGCGTNMGTAHYLENVEGRGYLCYECRHPG
jgi:hypothetical protein